ncbi:16S rRNA (cytosine(1402)-N(4))-methyltransferase RsmH [Coriobacteriia bacterium Es71-Z0120]|uniref:16S rRNA (cytosine(1402)-N(4))-methyltransferase RsmH n=1 Tax=Parvivirga hydrogeniphila TaxID=2939460 RepID=UPI0022610291|nr:16S rRNA (cytosine(1402)-N(4))-methyltransferase RsmH [Parvivirga hydrogeniphila]MCL4079113.1 16S rRNA (cytosine(1402)-N(4))-methyltransferase RsmH [Parvivirga hydrogeniphila]
MEYRHTPVLLAEVTQHLTLHDGSIVVDCTLGGAGHAKRAAQLIAPTGILVGIDKDDAALTAARDVLPLGQQTIILLKGDYGDLDDLLVEARIPYVDAFIFDLGVSSFQLDEAGRGFSYHRDAPLDMRMDAASSQPTAADIVNTYSEEELARVIREYGEERWASRIAAFIVAARARHPIATTGDLVDVVKAAIPAAARREGGHPAKRTFQALRIEVNQELRSVERGIESAIGWLVPGGRIAVISYHSLEDRIVKRIFADAMQGCVCPPGLPECACGRVPVIRVVTRRPIVPSAEEIAANPRARSAKLRVAEKVSEAMA